MFLCFTCSKYYSCEKEDCSIVKCADFEPVKEVGA
jgi:hypothetical protein